MSCNEAKSLAKVRVKLTYMHDLISTTYHEAGHVIIGLINFIKIPSVFVFQNKKNKRIEGICYYESIKDFNIDFDEQLLQSQIKREICFKYAGLLSEKNYFKIISGSDAFPKYLKNSSSDDILSASKMIKLANLAPAGSERRSLKNKLYNKTLSELQKHWDAVIIVAHALFKKKVLTFNNLKSLLTTKANDKKFWKEQFKSINYIFKNFHRLDKKQIKFILT